MKDVALFINSDKNSIINYLIRTLCSVIIDKQNRQFFATEMFKVGKCRAFSIYSVKYNKKE